MRRTKHEKSELQLKLEQEFPFMRQKEITGEQWEKGGYSDYDAYGCCVGKGWYSVLRGLCLDITRAYEKAGQSVDIVVRQVKEKYGALRFYCHPEGHDPGLFAFDLIGGGGLRMNPGDSDLHKKINEIVRKWETESAKVCETCGAEAERRTDIRWVTTLCEPCYAGVKAKREKHERKKKEREENPELLEAEREAERKELESQTLTAQKITEAEYSEGKPLFIPQWVRYIEDDVFDAMPWLDKIIVHEENKNYTTIEGVLFENRQYQNETHRHLVKYPSKMAKNPIRYEIPDGTQHILKNAFKGCENITAVSIPKTMDSNTIWGVFNDGCIKEIIIHPDNPAFTCVDGVLFSKYMTKLYAYPPLKKNEFYEVPDGIKSIWHDAFKNARNLTNIKISDSVGWIGHDVFEGCVNLTKITLPNVDFNKDQRIFYNCPKLERINISLDSENRKPIRLHSCDEVLYRGPITYQRGIKPEDIVEWTEYTLMRYPQAKPQDTYPITDGTSHIWVYAFAGACNLKTVTIPASVTEIGEGAFEGCYKELTFRCYEGSFALEYAKQQGFRVETLAQQPVSIIDGEKMTIFLPDICKTYSQNTPSELLKNAVKREIAAAKKNGIKLENIILYMLPTKDVEMPRMAFHLHWNGVGIATLKDAVNTGKN
ncbi:MAG: leucine-rich repeat domain-containing protein [Defluviitaleaceae bacterium]|nr:leucine-rich repeat domain-containing protein [Defluviitaleaceae bacterium]